MKKENDNIHENCLDQNCPGNKYYPSRIHCKQVHWIGRDKDEEYHNRLVGK